MPPDINANQLKRLFPGASKSTIARNQNHGGLQDTQPKPIVCDEPLGSTPGENKGTGRVTVSITSFRQRLLDADNLAGGAKYLLDGLRHAGLIHDDRPQDIDLKVSQEKVKPGEKERTEIVITTLAEVLKIVKGES